MRKEMLEGFRAGLEEEIVHVRAILRATGRADPIPFTAGRYAGREGGAAGFVYRWTLPPGAYRVREDDAVQIVFPDQTARGFVLAYESRARELVLSCDAYLGMTPGQADLVFDPTHLLEQCLAKLGEVEESPERFHPATALKLFGRSEDEPAVGDGEPRPSATYARLNRGQQSAVALVLGCDACFIWGPPGTGKTRTLGECVAQMAERGMRVLVVAHTNAAVDNGAAAIVAA
ncbi:MAG: AAA domain-containing protein, partial [Gemmatimonadota bacterium]